MSCAVPWPCCAPAASKNAGTQAGNHPSIGHPDLAHVRLLLPGPCAALPAGMPSPGASLPAHLMTSMAGRMLPTRCCAREASTWIDMHTGIGTGHQLAHHHELPPLSVIQPRPSIHPPPPPPTPPTHTTLLRRVYLVPRGVCPWIGLVGKSLHKLNFPVLTSSFRPLFDLPDAPSAVPPTSSEWVPGRPVPKPWRFY